MAWDLSPRSLCRGQLARRKQHTIYTAPADVERLEARQMLAADIVIVWNDILIEAVRNDTTQPGPTKVSKNMAIVQAAVYDAVNSINHTYTPYLTDVQAPAGTSVDAAVATAAHDALVAVYPLQEAFFDAELATSLAAVPNGPGKAQGIALGQLVAANTIELRLNDNSDVNNPYTPGTLPGQWRPDPTIDPAQSALGADWGFVNPFAIPGAAQFIAPPPPDLTSAEYTAAYNEVKSLGDVNSTTRTADQTEIGIFWGYDRGGLGPPPILYNQNVQDIAELQGNTLEENARLFALVNIALADAAFVCWHTKYEYDFWRPITAIREGDTDGNPDTEADADWIPLGAPGGGVVQNFTPPFPAYTSGHATFGAAVYETLENFYGTDDLHYTLTSDELPGVTRSFDSFSEAAEENGRSRIYLGIHWEFDNQEGQAQGREVADFVFDNFLLPVGEAGATVSIQEVGAGLTTAVLPDGASDVTLRRNGNLLELVNNDTNTVLLSSQLSEVQSVKFHGDNDADDLFTIDFAQGGTFAVPGGVEMRGGEGDTDVFAVIGTAGADTFGISGNNVSANGVVTNLGLVRQIHLNGAGGDDTFLIDGEPGSRRIELDGGLGNDRYLVQSAGAKLHINDAGGADEISFANSDEGVRLNLNRDSGQLQRLDDAHNTLRLTGTLETAIGTAFDDFLRGNEADNRLLGGDGDDHLYGRDGRDLLAGGNGKDTLNGGKGDDVLVGGAGNDQLNGGAGNGRDILIGGEGRDFLRGLGGGDILIGGATTHDNNPAALLNLFAEWTSSRSFQVRIDNLTDGSGSATRSNGPTFLRTTGPGATVLDDGERDKLFGGAGLDWILSFSGDNVKSDNS